MTADLIILSYINDILALEGVRVYLGVSHYGNVLPLAIGFVM
jgi:hypothetical protein